ncbi:MAG: hypothetical protein QF704_13845 [Anaerolineales bacterium]|jgi:hypothetical protein|nr:hypothetical protein [Anaerolineales bacterium]
MSDHMNIEERLDNILAAMGEDAETKCPFQVRKEKNGQWTLYNKDKNKDIYTGTRKVVQRVASEMNTEWFFKTYV